MKQRPFDNSTSTQRLKILSWLKTHKSLTTFDARNKLSVLHPAGRVQELKQGGYRIVTHWTVEYDTLNRPHRIARYVLLPRNYQVGRGRSYVH